MTARFIRSRLPLVAACALVVACGGGGGDDGGSDVAEVTEDEFVDEFNDVCEELGEDLVDYQTDVGEVDDEDVEGLVGLLEGTGEIYADAVDDLGEIDVPEDLQDEVDELLDLMEERADLTPDVIEALEEDDDSAFDEAIEEGAELADELDERNEELGLQCGSGGAEPTEDVSDDLSEGDDDSSDDFSEDFSDDFSDTGGEAEELGEPRSPGEVIPEYGTVDRDARFDGLADSCYEGELTDCDQLYQLSPVAESINSYEGYGATCGGRLDQEAPGTSRRGAETTRRPEAHPLSTSLERPRPLTWRRSGSGLVLGESAD